MAWDDDTLLNVFEKTDGRCHICRASLKFAPYGKRGQGAWHVEHSNPRARGGTNYRRNLLPACPDCNFSKGTGSTRSARAEYGYKKAPLSREKQDDVRTRNTLIGGGGAAVVGGLVGGPIGAAIGAFLGGAVGRSFDVEED